MSCGRFGWAVVVAGVVVVSVAAPVRAEEPVGAYLLMVTPESGAVTAKNLWCGPDGGTLDAPSKACAQLAAAGGEVGRIPARPGPCTLEYAPVRVSADGRWRGAPRHFARTYPNRCAAVRETGGILFR